MALSRPHRPEVPWCPVRCHACGTEGQVQQENDDCPWCLAPAALGGRKRNPGETMPGEAVPAAVPERRVMALDARTLAALVHAREGWKSLRETRGDARDAARERFLLDTEDLFFALDVAYRVHVARYGEPVAERL